MKSRKSRQISSQSPQIPLRKTLSNHNSLPPPPPPSTPSRPPPPNPSAMSTPGSDPASRGSNPRRSSRIAAKSGIEPPLSPPHPAAAALHVEEEAKGGNDLNRLIDNVNLSFESEVRVRKMRGSGSDSVRRSSRIASRTKSGGEDSGEKRKNAILESEKSKVRVLDFGSADVAIGEESDDSDDEMDVKEEEEVTVPDSPTNSPTKSTPGVVRRRSQRLVETNNGSGEMGDDGLEVIERREVPGGHNLASGGTRRRSPRFAHAARCQSDNGMMVEGVRVRGIQFDLNSTPDSQEKKVKLDLNLRPEEQGEEVPGMNNEDSSLVLNAASALMQLPQSIESERAKREVQWRARSRSRRMQRFQDVARDRASHFAHFRDEEDGVVATASASDNVPASEEIEDWPGPFSTAMKIIKDRNKKLNVPNAENASSTAPVIHWSPSKNSVENRAKLDVPSLKDLCLEILAKNAEAIGSLKYVPNDLKNKLTNKLCVLRKMDSRFMDLLVADSLEVVRVADCSWLTEEQITKTFAECDMSKLSVLQLDLCGRSMTDYMIRDTLARSPNCLPSLVSISLKGACRLTDTGLGLLVASSPSLRSINLSQCSLITSVGIDTIASRLGLLLLELFLDDCQSIDAMLMLPSLRKLKCLEVLSVSDIQTVCDDFVCHFVTEQGSNMKELGLANCTKLTDLSVKAIAENCSALCALDLRNLLKLTDISTAHLANGCSSIQTLNLSKNQSSDETIAAFLETSGHSLKDLSLNGVKNVGPNTAISLAKNCTSNLQCLDLSWCRNLTNEALGYIVDSCLSLRKLNVFGCTQITGVFVNGHSNHQLRIIGLPMTPILEHLDALDHQDGPLRYSDVPLPI